MVDQKVNSSKSERSHSKVSLFVTDFISLSSDVDWVEKDVLPRLFPHPQYGIDLVLCHNDVNCKNILHDSSSQSITFIDFEYCAINFALFDIANHFIEYAGVDQIDFDRYPKRDEQCRWLEIYFKARKMPFDDPEKICHLIDQLAALSHLCFGLWALAQVCFTKCDYDYASYGRRRVNRFRELKSLLCN
jgi:ethanolamine kinase